MEVQDKDARRRYESGAVKLRSNGRWEGQLRLPAGARKYVYAHSRADVIVRLREERWRLECGIPVRVKGLQLGAYIKEWLAVTRSRVRPRTYDAYELSLNRIERLLGTVPLTRLNPHLIQRAYGELLASGLSPRTVLQSHAVLHRALKQARWGLTNTLPTDLVAVPRPRQREMRALSAEQLSMLLVSSRSSHWYPLWVVLGTAGLRIGEALGLKWCDVDLTAGRLQVRRALQRQRGRGLVFVEPKSYRSRRMVCLCRLAIEALSELRDSSDGELIGRLGSPAGVRQSCIKAMDGGGRVIYADPARTCVKWEVLSMPVDCVNNTPWLHFHDREGFIQATRTCYPASLAELIEISSNHSKDERLHAAGSHWALSDAAVADHTFIETGGDGEARHAMASTLYDVIPGAMSPELLDAMAAVRPSVYGNPQDEPFVDPAFYVIHVEAGKRIYQAYSELDQGDTNKASLAELLARAPYNNDGYRGPWAFRTLGGAGGQTVVGAFSTGTHGGDWFMGPIADDVVAIHLVADGGHQFWLEPDTPPLGHTLTDAAALHQIYDKFGPFDVIRDDDLFDAARISVGRFGTIYSVVLRVVRQYSLHEKRRLNMWESVVDDVLNPASKILRGDDGRNRFLQVAISLTPCANFSGHQVGITQRWNDPPDPDAVHPRGRAERVGDIVPGKEFDPTLGGPRFEHAGNQHTFGPDKDHPEQDASPSFLDRACENPDFLEGVIQEAVNDTEDFIKDGLIYTGGPIGLVAAAGADSLSPLIEPLRKFLEWLLHFFASHNVKGGGKRFGQVVDELRQHLLTGGPPSPTKDAGLLARQLISNKVFTSQQAERDFNAISYAVMDSHDYLDESCQVNVDSIEVFFDVNDPRLRPFIEAVLAFEIRQEWEGFAAAGYMSLRFVGQGRGLLAPERFGHTVAIEISALRDVNGSTQLVDFARLLARNDNFRGILHWGQGNDSTKDEIDARFGQLAVPPSDDLDRWRQALGRFTNNGALDGYSSAFTRRTGLEVHP